MMVRFPANLYFMKGEPKTERYRPSSIGNFWAVENQIVTTDPGVCILLARRAVTFRYPNGRTPVFYIGTADNLDTRLRQHVKAALDCKKAHRNERVPENSSRHENPHRHTKTRDTLCLPRAHPGRTSPFLDVRAGSAPQEIRPPGHSGGTITNSVPVRAASAESPSRANSVSSSAVQPIPSTMRA